MSSTCSTPAATEAEPDAGRPRRELITIESVLEEALSLLNLVNFGGGCYTVYAAELNDGMVRVDKELYGDVFRRPPKLTLSRPAPSAWRSSSSGR